MHTEGERGHGRVRQHLAPDQDYILKSLSFPLCLRARELSTRITIAKALHNLSAYSRVSQTCMATSQAQSVCIFIAGLPC